MGVDGVIPWVSAIRTAAAEIVSFSIEVCNALSSILFTVNKVGL